MGTEILDANLEEQASQLRRRNLLPWWIKVFVWIFIVFGVFAVIGIFIALAGIRFQVGLYGLKTMDPLSETGLILTGIFLLKGIVSYALWTEKDWAITIGQIDAIIGILVCAYVMFITPVLNSPHEFKISFRLELLLLIPYLIKLRKIKNEWNKLKEDKTTAAKSEKV